MKKGKPQFNEARTNLNTLIQMKRILIFSSLLLALTARPFSALAADAPAAPTPATAAPADATPKLKAPGVEERLADLEAYVNNGARGNVANANLDTKVGGPGPGHNGFQMICTALVLFMTLPGLALFYGGLVRRKNVLSVLAQCLGIAGLVTILWWLCGYSLAFSKGGAITGVLGSLDWKFLAGVDSTPNTDYSAWVSHNVFSMYQLMFAIITPALIIGAIAERMRFSAILLFVTLWMFIVYFPLAHMVWGSGRHDERRVEPGGQDPRHRLRRRHRRAHVLRVVGALILCLILGKRLGFGKEPMPPHNMVLCMVGTGMLWVGWYGFNAGSAVAADGIAANAFTTTTLATAVASFTWAMAEYIFRGKPSILGFCSGAVAGLVVITPACGFVTTTGAVIIGVVAGLIPYLACWKLKSAAGYDDALDTFGVHAVGGTLGALLTGFLASAKANPNLVSNLADVGNKLEAANPATQNGLAKLVADGGLWVEQLKAIGVTLCLAIVGTTLIAYIVKAVLGLRVAPEIEVSGLDLSEHGEEGYHTAGQL